MMNDPKYFYNKIIELKKIEPNLFSFLDEVDHHFYSKIELFYNELINENEFQNLTRLTSRDDFFEGHLLDVLHLEESNYLNFLDNKIPFDLGSGGGIPGLLHAFLFNKKWILCDSEKQKALFLSRFIGEQSLIGSSVVSTRAEDWLSSHGKISINSQIITRAVGTVTKISIWLEKCSTWNQLILFKGPNWENEWAEFQLSRFRNKLKIKNEYSYTVGVENKIRKIILLEK